MRRCRANPEGGPCDCSHRQTGYRAPPRRGPAHRHRAAPAARRAEGQVRIAELVRRVVSQPGAVGGHDDARPSRANAGPMGGVHQEVQGRDGGAGGRSHARRAGRSVAPGQFLGGLLLRVRSALPPLGVAGVAGRARRQGRLKAHASRRVATRQRGHAWNQD